MTENQSNSIKIESSLLKKAATNDEQAISLMFQQFLPDDEHIIYIQYLGLKGLWGFGTYEFACLTNRRVADITVGRFGEVVYQDGYLEGINSKVIYQPSKLGLYLWIGLYCCFSLPFFLVPLLFLPFVVQIYYSLVKCGILLVVKDGISVFMFTNRKYIGRANTLCRHLTIAREDRLKSFKHI